MMANTILRFMNHLIDLPPLLSLGKTESGSRLGGSLDCACASDATTVASRAMASL
jgi:hypothetical protein